jgi:Flp pilus assembly protein TadD
VAIVHRWAALVLSAACLSGCQQLPRLPAATGPLLGADDKRQPVVDGPHIADVQIAMAHTQESQGELEQAQATYQEALKRDPKRADAAERLAVLCDRLGRCAASQEWYQKAQPGRENSPDFHCNKGYSEYLQGRFAEAEQHLRRAIALEPCHRRAHNNLGLVLAQTGRCEEALAEFRAAGCTPAETHVNLGFALCLQGSWPEARAEYEKAVAADPSCVPAKQGLKQVTDLVAHAGARCPVAPGGAPPMIRPVSASLGTPMTLSESNPAAMTPQAP